MKSIQITTMPICSLHLLAVVPFMTTFSTTSWNREASIWLQHIWPRFYFSFHALSYLYTRRFHRICYECAIKCMPFQNQMLKCHHNNFVETTFYLFGVDFVCGFWGMVLKFMFMNRVNREKKIGKIERKEMEKNRCTKKWQFLFNPKIMCVSMGGNVRLNWQHIFDSY